MERLTLVIDSEGRMVLSLPGDVSPANLAGIRASFEAWKAAQPPELLVVPRSEVVRVETIELALEGDHYVRPEAVAS